MAYLVSDLINEALQEINFLFPGQTPNASGLARAFSILNALVDSLNTDRLNIYNLTTLNISAPLNSNPITVGPTGNLNVAWPTFIESASIRDANFNWSLEMINEQEYNAIIDQDTVGLPRKLYDDGAYPIRSLWMWPAPSAHGYTLYLFTWTLIAQFVATTDPVAFPPGYQEALKYLLAVRLAAPFGMVLKQETKDNAAAALTALRNRNAQLLPGALDPSTVTGAPARGLPGG